MVSTPEEVERRLQGGSGTGQGEYKVEAVYNITGAGTVITGEVVSGTLESGLIARYENEFYAIIGIVKDRDHIPFAYPGDSLSLNVKKLNKEGEKVESKGIIYNILNSLFSFGNMSNNSTIPKGTILKFVRKEHVQDN